MTTPAGIDELPLARLREAGGKEFEDRIIRLFLLHVPVRLATARAAGAAGDLEGVRFHAHSLKASAGQLGATRMADLCREAERLGEAGDPAAVALLNEAGVELEAMCDLLKARLVA